MDRDEARALMAGLLGEQLMKFPLRWCKPDLPWNFRTS
ncbi:Uncharacterised protein [Burkholderia pseudomallei]|nr:Uncharacterised protein [Burkholderia pseudomallei]CAJ7193800.1 Uncharacterised protein [Burkholderia pseudomallei]